MKFVLTNAVKSKLENEIIVLFFFNARREELEKTTEGMYRALLFQILHGAPDLQEILDNANPSDRSSVQSSAWVTKNLKSSLPSN